MTLADEAVRRSGGTAQVYFKFTCTHCGARCTFSEANTLYENGECFTCGRSSKVEKAGFMLVLSMGQPHVDASAPLENACPHGLPIDFMYPCLICEKEHASDVEDTH